MAKTIFPSKKETVLAEKLSNRELKKFKAEAFGIKRFTAVINIMV
jgi:hypothetical protein